MLWASRESLVARASVTVAFGLALILWPGISVAVFVLVFGAFALVDGVLILVNGTAAPRGEPARALAIWAGALAGAIGVLTLVWPQLTEVTLVLLVALRVLVVGISELVASLWICRRWGALGPAWLLGTIGALSSAFGVLLLVYPGTGVVALAWAIGVYAFALGLMVLARAFVPAGGIPSALRH